MPCLVTALKMLVKEMDPEFSLFSALMQVCTCVHTQPEFPCKQRETNSQRWEPKRRTIVALAPREVLEGAGQGDTLFDKVCKCSPAPVLRERDRARQTERLGKLGIVAYITPLKR